MILIKFIKQNIKHKKIIIINIHAIITIIYNIIMAIIYFLDFLFYIIYFYRKVINKSKQLETIIYFAILFK